MNTSQLQNWLQLSGNVGVIIGLILVAVQLKQNSDLATAGFVAAAMTQETDHINATMGENPPAVYAKAISNPGELTLEDSMVLYGRVEWWLSMMRRNAWLEELSIWDDSWRQTYLPLAASALGSDPVSKAYFLQKPADSDWMKELQDRVRSASSGAGATPAEPPR